MPRRAAHTAMILLALCLGTPACGSDSQAACHAGADCASGLCRSDGTCAPVAADANGGDASTRFAISSGGDVLGSDGQSTGGQTQDGNSTSDSGQDGSGADTSKPDVTKGDADTASAGCVPNHDGVVSRSESNVAIGLHAKYAVGLKTTVSLAPSKGADGLPVWDFSGKYDGDHASELVTQDPAKAWYGKYFAGATYAIELGETSGLIGVFKLTDSELLLMGAVSPEDGLFATRITYDPPIPTLQFPLQVGQTWTSDATASGLYQGVISAWSEKLEMEVVQAGAVKTPLGAFPVLQVRGKTSKLIGLLTTVYRTQAFVAECYGAVAKVDSEMNESAADFSDAAEIRRLSP